MRSSSRLAARAKVLQIWMDQKVHKKKESKSTLFAVRGVSLRGEMHSGPQYREWPLGNTGSHAEWCLLIQLIAEYIHVCG